MWYIPVRDTTLNMLIRLSPVSVNFVSANKIGLSPNGIRIGVYCYCNSLKLKIEPYIEILNSLSKYKKINTLLHEIGHAKCDKEKCPCMKLDDYIEGEIHAYKYTLEWLLKNKQKKALKIEIEHIEDHLGRTDYYCEAAKHIMKLKLWQKCLDYVK